jgi:hypothetical protein
VYKLATAPQLEEVEEEQAVRKAVSPELVGDEEALIEDLPLPEGDEDLADLEEADEALVGDEEEPFIEPEDEEDGDVTDILGPVGEDDDEER